MLSALGLFRVEGFGGTRASQTSKNTKSMRETPEVDGGGSRAMRFHMSVSSGLPGGEPVFVPVTGMSQPLTTAHRGGDFSLVVGWRPNLNQLLHRTLVVKACEQLVSSEIHPEGVPVRT